ncbi:MAG: hypothetical protein RQ757_11200 [Pseudomonadales bacterium]|nr:hypothetical protein [Pseudomonadales bacterium]
MSTGVFIVNDNAITLGDESGLILSSPGYVVVVDKQILFGDEAARLNRIHPVNASNEFWYRLSMDPLSRPLAHFRHTADIVHAHLLHMAQAADVDGEIILAVPASYNRQQLAILLGLFKQSPFQVVGLVDSALLGAAAQKQHGGTDSLLVMEQHLHQTLLTRCEQPGNELKSESLVQVPDTGWAACTDSLVQLLTDTFIQQSRFNPQHSAQWEQHLYDVLPAWLQQNDDAENTLLLEIATDKSTHQAKLTRASLAARLRPLYQKIHQHLPRADADLSRVLLSEQLDVLPGIHELVHNAAAQPPLAIANKDMIETALALQSQLQQSGQGLQFTRRLDLGDREAFGLTAATGAQQATTQNRAPSHVLLGHEAWPLRDGLILALDEDGSQLRVNGSAGKASTQLARLEETQQGGMVLRQVEAGLLLNGQPLSEARELEIGDRLSYRDQPQALELIKVRDGA